VLLKCLLQKTLDVSLLRQTEGYRKAKNKMSFFENKADYMTNAHFQPVTFLRFRRCCDSKLDTHLVKHNLTMGKLPYK